MESDGNIFLTVIVPVYGVESYLRQCVDSLLAIDCQDMEIILVDDGGHDGCPAICDGYAVKDNRVMVVHQANGGAAAARNAGLDRARGRWLWYVDGDDYVLPAAAEKVISHVRSADCDYVQFGFARANAAGDIVEECPAATSDGADSNTFFLAYPLYYHWSAWFSRDIVERHCLRFTPGVRIAEDQEMMYACQMYVRRPVQVAATVYCYRQREGSVMHDKDARSHAVSDAFTVLDHWRRRLADENITPSPWINAKLLRFVKTLLYGARHLTRIERHTLQVRLCRMLDDYAALDFSFPRDKRLQIARRSVTVYLLLNKIYLLLKGY